MEWKLKEGYVEGATVYLVQEGRYVQLCNCPDLMKQQLGSAFESYFEPVTQQEKPRKKNAHDETKPTDV